jgi:hypothetical protein
MTQLLAIDRCTPGAGLAVGAGGGEERRSRVIDYGVLLGCAVPARARLRHGHLGVDADRRSQLR